MEREKSFFNENQNILLEIAEDEYAAYLTIIDNNDFIDETEVLDLIKKSGIVFGIEEAKEFIAEKGLEREFDKPFPIAIGKRIIDPQVEFSIIFNLENSIQSENKTVNLDFSQLEFKEKISSHQPLAHLFVTKKAQTGMNIFGEDVLPEISEQEVIKNYLGENVYYSEERSQIFSETAGYPYIDELNRVSVKNHFVIDGDIGIEQKNFSLSGDLTVNGSIKDKISINIDGNLFVKKDINDATIFATGKIVVDGDILNCKQGEINSLNNIDFYSAENATIITPMKINFKKNAHFCRLIAEKGIFGDSQESSIIGGLTQSGENIEVAIIGNSSAIGTEVEITIAPYIKEKMLTMTKNLMKLKDNPDENQEMIESMSDEISELENKLEEEINKAIMNNDSIPQHITVFKKIFGGTYLRVLRKSRTIVEELEQVSFTIVDGELVVDQF